MRPNRLRLRYWSVSAFLLALIPCWWWFNDALPRANNDLQEDFVFLEKARHAVLPGNSYTVRASDPAIERRLFDASLGLTPERVAKRTLYDRRRRAIPDDVRYVIAYGDFTGGEKLQFVVRFERGAVYERRAER